MKVRIIKALFGLIILMPVILWFASGNNFSDFSDFYSVMSSLGKLFGLVGMSLFACTLILGSRLKIWDKLLNGLNLVYINHHLVGTATFIFLLFHPIFLAVNYFSVSALATLEFFLPSLNNIPRSFGVISLFLMIALLLVTFYSVFKYHVWQQTHRFLLLAFLFGYFHLLFIPSDTSVYLPLRFYMIVLSTTAIFFQLYNLLGRNLADPPLKYKVAKVVRLDKIWVIEMKPEGKKLEFKSGQFAFYSFKTKGLGKEWHPFTISSAPEDEILQISVKSLGDYTSHLDKVTVGDEVKVYGPFGKFNYDAVPNKKQIWVAGGIGITPFLSMMRDLPNDYEAHLYWSVRNYEEAIFLEDLKKKAETSNNFKFFLVSTDKKDQNLVDVYSTGYLTADTMKKGSSEIKDKEIFLCGPKPMANSLREQFKKIKIEKFKIHSEEFSL